jgi:large subunit ribosomal protein L6
MSRLGKKSIVLPAGVTVNVAPDNTVTIKGTKGTLTRKFDRSITITVEKDQIKIARQKEDKKIRALHGTTRMLIANMIQGVANGFEKNLEVVGVGYRFAAQGTGLQLSMGFSHPIAYTPSTGIKFALEGQTGVKVQGIDKQLVGQVAAEIRDFRGPEPYKGKGIKYKGEHIVRKAGKAGKGAGAGATAGAAK